MMKSTYSVEVGTERYVLRDMTSDHMLTIARMLQAAQMRNADVVIRRGDNEALAYTWRFCETR